MEAPAVPSGNESSDDLTVLLRDKQGFATTSEMSSTVPKRVLNIDSSCNTGQAPSEHYAACPSDADARPAAGSPRTPVMRWPHSSRGVLAICPPIPAQVPENSVPSPEPVRGWRCTTRLAITAATATIASPINGNSL